MGIKVKARQTKLAIGPSAGQYRFIMIADIYSTLKPEKVISEASLRSGIAKGTITATWEAIGDVIKNWATEGHSVPIPGLGTMRFGVRATSSSKSTPPTTAAWTKSPTTPAPPPAPTAPAKRTTATPSWGKISIEVCAAMQYSRDSPPPGRRGGTK